MIRKTAFFSGLILGSSICAWWFGATLIYFFTGKIPTIQFTDKKPGLKLVEVDLLYEEPTIIEKETDEEG